MFIYVWLHFVIVYYNVPCPAPVTTIFLPLKSTDIIFFCSLQFYELIQT